MSDKKCGNWEGIGKAVQALLFLLLLFCLLWKAEQILKLIWDIGAPTM